MNSQTPATQSKQDSTINQELQNLNNRIDELGDTLTLFMDEMRAMLEPLAQKKVNDANKPTHQMSRRVRMIATEAGCSGIKSPEEGVEAWDLKGRLPAPLFELLKSEYCPEKFSTDGIKGFIEDHGIKSEKPAEPKSKKKAAA
jgi:hypothetical protein